MAFKLNFYTLNVGMSSTLAGLPSIVKSENLDVLFLQEVCLSANQIRNLLRGYDASVNYDENNLSTPGTALVWREGFQFQKFAPLFLAELKLHL